MGARLDLNLRVVLSKLVKTVLVMFAVLIALPAVGIDVTVLSVFGGAIGVGIGFGLQKIAANYLSGFVMLLDRSVSLGALVTIDGHYGEVTKLTARYVVRQRAWTGPKRSSPTRRDHLGRDQPFLFGSARARRRSDSGQLPERRRTGVAS